jgi:hypothetical protein
MQREAIRSLRGMRCVIGHEYCRCELHEERAQLREVRVRQKLEMRSNPETTKSFRRLLQEIRLTAADDAQNKFRVWTQWGMDLRDGM